MPPTFNAQANTPNPKVHNHEPILVKDLAREKEAEFLAEMFMRNDRLEMQKYYQDVLDAAEKDFDNYAGKKRPRFEFTSDPNCKTAYFSTDPKGGNPEIKVGLEFFVKNKLSAEQAVWVLMHELTHFTDYAADRSEYMGQFEKAEKLGVDMADKIVEYRKQNEMDEMPETQKKMLSSKIGKIYSSIYYNITNDIYVNHNVATTEKYSHDKLKNKNSKQAEVGKLYKDILFPGRDFSVMPEYYQYMYFLLRGENVSEGMRVTEGAEVALAKDYEVNYKKYDKRRGFPVTVKKVMNAESLIKTFLNPNSEEQFEGDTLETRNFNKKDTSLKYRSKYIDETLLLTFSDLLFEDLKDKVDNTPDIDDILKMLQDILDKAGESSPDFVPDEVLGEYADWKEKSDKKDEEEKVKQEQEEKDKKEKRSDDKKAKPNEPKVPSKTPEEVRDKAMKKGVEDFAENNNINPDVAQRVYEAMRDTDPYIQKLNELWRRITASQGSETTHSVKGRYKTGIDVNVDAVVDQIADIVARDMDKLHIMHKVERKENPVDRPERIEVSLVIDQSGSMDEKKNIIVERVLTMLNVSMDNFNQFLMHVRGQSKSKLHVDTEVIAFGDNAKVISPFRYINSGVDGVTSDINSGQKGIVNYKSLESVGVEMGYTYDNTALEEVEKRLVSGEVKEKIVSGKIMKIVFEITDGGSSDQGKAKEIVDSLAKQGVLVYAFQIGEVGYGEENTFNSVWNTGGDGVKRGFVLGDDYGKLPEVMTQMLEEFLGEVKIYE